MSDTPTPRTDAEIARVKAVLDQACTSGDWPAPVCAIGVDFARQLECELAAAHEALKKSCDDEHRLSEEVAKLTLELAEAHAQAYAYISECHRTKDTLATVIPALEAASGLKADEMRDNCPADIELTRNEWAALWMARAILERPEATPC